MKLVLFVLKNKEKGVEKKEGEEANRNLSAKLFRLLHLGYDHNSKQHHGNKD
jgi:hypothetical protein